MSTISNTKSLKTIVIDNYDSFVFNIVQYIGELGGNPEVFRNDKITIEEIKKMNPTHIVISPGPGDPTDKNYFGVSSDVILELGKTIPVLGVCLGHQGITSCFGGKVIKAPVIMHGKTSNISHDSSVLFHKIESPFVGMRYHSLVAEEESFPECLTVTARVMSEKSENNMGMIMALEHKEFPIYGVQFHPESIGSPNGKQMIKNFLNISL